VSESATELRQVVASEHGLDPEAAKFLAGSTLSELDESAAALAKLLGERREQEPASVPDFFTSAATAKAERQRALLDIVTGRMPEQPRDKRGRFTSGFDGGARPAVPPPAESHDETLVRILRSREADSGAGF
jgi:hypothetical protein